MKNLGQLTINNYVIDNEDLSSSIRYFLGTPITESNLSTIQLEDRTINVFIPSEQIDTLSAILPEGINNLARDTFLRIDLTNPTSLINNIVFVLPNNTLATIEVADKSAVETKNGTIIIGSSLDIEEGAATMLHLTEVMQDTFYLTAKKMVAIQK